MFTPEETKPQGNEDVNQGLFNYKVHGTEMPAYLEFQLELPEILGQVSRNP